MSSSSSSSSASLLTSSIYRMSGTQLASGLDTDSIIYKLTAGTQSKIDTQKKMEQLAEWKQEAYRDITKQLQTFQKTYFSYTSSNTNLLSSSFFDITSLVSSSPLVKASGSTSNAQNMIIQSISSLATKASFTSGQRVSNDAIVSGQIQTEWSKSAIGGKTLKLEYEGTDYTIRFSGDLLLNSNDPSEDKVQKIVNDLNKQINAAAGLNGKVVFEKTDDGKITLKTTDSSKRVAINDYESDSKDTSGKKLLDTLGFTVGASGSSITGSAVNTSTDGYLFNKTVDSDSEISLNVNGQTHTLTLGKSYDISDGTPDSIAKNIANLLQKQIDADADLKGKVTASSNGGKVSFQTTGSDVNISIEGGSKNLINGLGLTEGGAASTEVSGTGIDKKALTTSYLPDMLTGNSLIFNLDGINKTISFDKNDLQSGENFNSADGIKNYLTRKLSSTFGTGKVTVDETGGTLVLKTTDPNSVLSLSATDSTNVLSKCGALRIDSGESNRLELGKTLEELSNELNPQLNLSAGSDGKYTLKVNGKEFKFSKTDTLSHVITKINDDSDANVTVSYSQTTDSFRVTCNETGSQGTTDIEDVTGGGNLAGVLFGERSAGTTKDGTDLHMKVALNGSATPLDIVRSSNMTTIDGVDLTVTGTTTDKDGNVIDNADITFSADNNVDDLYKKITGFIDDYNKIINAINNKINETTDKAYPPMTDEQKKNMSQSEITAWENKAKVGVLQNDSYLSNILFDMRNAMTDIVNSNGSSLSSIGISTVAYDYTSGGQLTVNTDALKKALAANPDKIASMFTNEDGISQRVNTVLNKNVGTFGGDGVLLLVAGLDTRTVDDSELGKRITDYKKTISDLNKDLTAQRNRYWNQFTAMEQALSKMVSQSSYLTSMLNNKSS